MSGTALTLNDTLNRLLFEHKIRPTELARQTNIPQATIQRLTVGVTARPHRDTLEAIATFFDISVEQLLGEKPIPGISSNALETGYKRIPLLDSTRVLDLDMSLGKKHQTVITDAMGGNRMFALRMVDTAMDPVFPENTLLIIDPDLIPRDRNYVVVRLWKHTDVILRQLLVDGPDLFIKALNTDFAMRQVKENDVIMGVLVQTKRDYV